MSKITTKAKKYGTLGAVVIATTLIYEAYLKQYVKPIADKVLP